MTEDEKVIKELQDLVNKLNDKANSLYGQYNISFFPSMTSSTNIDFTVSKILKRAKLPVTTTGIGPILG